MSGQANLKATPQRRARPVRSGPVRWGLRWGLRFVTLFWIIAFFLALLILIVWMNRAGFAEWYTVRALEKRGYDVSLDIESLDPDRAVANNVTVRYRGETVFSADKVSADYTFADLGFQSLDRLDIAGPDVSIIVDGSGQIISPWVQGLMDAPKPEGSAGAIAFPAKGIFVTDGRARVDSPYGVFDFALDAEIRSRFDLAAKLEFDKNRVSSEVFNAVLDGTVIAAQEGEGVIGLQTDLTLSGLKAREIEASLLSLSTQLSLSQAPGGTQIGVSGLANINGENLVVPGLRSAAFDVKTESTARLDTADFGQSDIRSSVRLTTQNSGLTDPALITGLAANLTANEGLKAAPISQYFADRLTRNVAELLTQSDVSFDGEIVRNSETLEVIAKAPVSLFQTDSLYTRIQPDAARALYRYSAGLDGKTGRFAIAASAAYRGGEDLSIEGLRVDGMASSAFGWDAIRSVKAKVSSAQTWLGQADGLLVRLAPFTADLDVQNRTKGARVNVDMNLDYDGPLPGGDVTRLTAEGRLTVDSTAGPLSVSFVPKGAGDNAGRVSLARFDSPIGWRASDLSFTYSDPRPFFIAGEPARLEAKLTDVKGRMISEEQGQDFNLDMTALTVAARLFGDRQNWDMQMRDAHITSDTFPGPGSDIRAQVLDVTVSQTLDDPVQFTAESPSATVVTDLFALRDVGVSAAGTPAAYDVRYENGKVSLAAAPDIPALAVTGDAALRDGIWRGDASTFLPGARDTPILLDYDYQNGNSEVRVDIPVLKFRPNGLQPQNLIPILKGRIANVTGDVRANLVFNLPADGEMTSYGTAFLDGLDLGTLVGPFEGITSALKFNSILPLQTDGVQTLTVDLFDPGLPLQNGQATFELLPGGIDLQSVSWPLGTGEIALEPTLWAFGGGKNRVILNIANVGLETLLERFGRDDLVITGQVFGRIPVNIDGVSLLVDNGLLEVKGGGVIQFKSDGTSAAANANDKVALAFNTLENFRYEKLEATLNGPLDGMLNIYSEFMGKNPDVLGGAEFLFRLNLDGNLMKLAKAFSNGSPDSELQELIETSGASDKKLINKILGQVVTGQTN